MTQTMKTEGDDAREPVLSPVDRISELLFGLLMALSFTGAISVAESGKAEIHEMFIAAFGCNLAWGIVDAVMYVVRVVTDRGRALTIAHAVRRAANPEGGRAVIEQSLSRQVAGLLSPTEVEAVRGRIMALPSLPERPRLRWGDIGAGLAVFALVVLSTFPVVLPFALMVDVGEAKNWSRGIALVMLFLGGLGFARYAGYGGWGMGFVMTGLGTLLVGAILALGG